MAVHTPQEQSEDGPGSTSESVVRLAVEFPNVEPDVIRTLLEASLRRTSGARVQHFRLVLAEREVRNLLRIRRAQPEDAGTSLDGPGATSTTSMNTTTR